MHILMTAYACHPSMGSEHGNGWNWPMHVAARGHDVTVLTTPACTTRSKPSFASGLAPD